MLFTLCEKLWPKVKKQKGIPHFRTKNMFRIIQLPFFIWSWTCFFHWLLMSLAIPEVFLNKTSCNEIAIINIQKEMTACNSKERNEAEWHRNKAEWHQNGTEWTWMEPEYIEMSRNEQKYGGLNQKRAKCDVLALHIRELCDGCNTCTVSVLYRKSLERYSTFLWFYIRVHIVTSQVL